MFLNLRLTPRALYSKRFAQKGHKPTVQPRSHPLASGLNWITQPRFSLALCEPKTVRLWVVMEHLRRLLREELW